MRLCLNRPTVARSCNESFPLPECLVQPSRSALNLVHDAVQVLIVFFDCSTTLGRSDAQSGSMSSWSDLKVVSTRRRSSLSVSMTAGASETF